MSHGYHVNGLVQERRNSIANALELRLSCTNPLMWYPFLMHWRCCSLALNHGYQVNGLVQERCNSIANALELRLSCTNPSMWSWLPTFFPPPNEEWCHIELPRTAMGMATAIRISGDLGWPIRGDTETCGLQQIPGFHINHVRLDIFKSNLLLDNLIQLPWLSELWSS